ncbi:MAG: hypothetical protein NW220_17815 [Leptolyngbyaceae cyanobacterium bins.349]|nr:hypothetical protein [Leptolyngbyaceae cyanobacterium bins.349]
MKIQIRFPFRSLTAQQPNTVSIRVNSPTDEVQVQVETEEVMPYCVNSNQMIELEVLMRPV